MGQRVKGVGRLYISSTHFDRNFYLNEINIYFIQIFFFLVLLLFKSQKYHLDHIIKNQVTTRSYN